MVSVVGVTASQMVFSLFSDLNHYYMGYKKGSYS